MTPNDNRPPHPAEIDFDAWCEQWLRRRIDLWHLLGQPLPTPEELTREMLKALQSDNPQDW